MAHDDKINDKINDDPEYEDPDCVFDGDKIDAMLQCVTAGPDPLDFSNPDSAYRLMSDDAQDDIEGAGGRKMKCMSCGHVFMGELHDDCPECLGPEVKEIG